MKIEREMILVDKEEYYKLVHEVVELKKVKKDIHDLCDDFGDLPKVDGKYNVEYVYRPTGDIIRDSVMYYTDKSGNGKVGFDVDPSAYMVIKWWEI